MAVEVVTHSLAVHSLNLAGRGGGGKERKETCPEEGSFASKVVMVPPSHTRVRTRAWL